MYQLGSQIYHPDPINKLIYIMTDIFFRLLRCVQANLILDIHIHNHEKSIRNIHFLKYGGLTSPKIVYF